MKQKELYELNVWGKQKFALLLPYEAEKLSYQKENIDKKREILSVRLIDGALIPSDAIEDINNARNTNLVLLIDQLKKIFPKKLENLILDRNGNVINPEYKMLGFSKINNHDCLYNFLFGNKLFVYEKTVKVKAKVSAVIDAEIEVPEGCNLLDYSDFIKKNKNYLKISDIDYTIDDMHIIV